MNWPIVLGVLGIVVSVIVGWVIWGLVDRRVRNRKYRVAKAELARGFAAQMSDLKAEIIPQRLDATDDRICQFEYHIHAALPADYRAFLSLHSGVWVSATCPIVEPTPCGDTATIEAFYGFMSDERHDPSDFSGNSDLFKGAPAIIPITDGRHHPSDLYWNSDLFEGAPVIIPIAEGAFGSRIFLFLRGRLSGSIFFYDGENRHFWPDNKFHSMYENLSPKLQTYLDLRRKHKLPKKSRGMENYYRVADSFTSFIESCEYWDLNADDDEAPT